MTPDPEGAPVAPAFSSNGTSPAHRTAAASERGAEAAEQAASILAQLPQALAQGFAMVLQQVPVQTRQHICANCLVARIAWEATYGRELKAAIASAGAAHGLAEGDPRAAALDPAPHLPPDLQPGARNGIPPLTAAVTTVGGTEVCSEHIPGRPGSQKLLVVTGALSPSALAGLG